MGWDGQVAAGAGFLNVGLLQAYGVVKTYRSQATGRSRIPLKGVLRLIELISIAIIAVLHIVVNLFTYHASQSPGFIVGSSVSLERTGVAALFLFYSLVGLLTEYTSALPLPVGILELIASFAFWEEFLLFYFPTSQHAGLEGQYHLLLLIPIAVCLLSMASEIAYPLSNLPPLARSFALVFQGTWFFQMGMSMFTTRWIANGCELDDKGSNYSVRCQDMQQLMVGKSLANLQFNCHLAFLLLCMLPLYTLMSKLYTNSATYGNKDSNLELSQATHFYVLENEDEEEAAQPET